jgi:hypothetical protein
VGGTYNLKLAGAAHRPGKMMVSDSLVRFPDSEGTAVIAPPTRLRQPIIASTPPVGPQPHPARSPTHDPGQLTSRSAAQLLAVHTAGHDRSRQVTARPMPPPLANANAAAAHLGRARRAEPPRAASQPSPAPRHNPLRSPLRRGGRCAGGRREPDGAGRAKEDVQWALRAGLLDGVS